MKPLRLASAKPLEAQAAPGSDKGCLMSSKRPSHSHQARHRWPIIQRLRRAPKIAVTSAVEYSAGNAELIQDAFGRQARQLDDPLLSSLSDEGTSVVAAPICGHAFVSRRFSSVRSTTHSFRARAPRHRRLLRHGSFYPQTARKDQATEHRVSALARPRAPLGIQPQTRPALR